jgi:poly-gamma-glutamate capsule biosynthesis protein CapA/YwtB (metallophosphatase superfamily)
VATGLCGFLLLTSIGCGSETQPSLSSAELPASGPITIALTGDSSFTTLAGTASSAVDLVRGATIGFTNLEVDLLDADRARDAQSRPAPRWIFAPGDQARDVAALGFDVVSLANNHAMDFGAEGLTSTMHALDTAGIVHAGAGVDLAAARAPAFVGGGPRRVAFVAVTASASDRSRASASQQDIQGRPGVNPLMFDAAITLDPATFRALAQSVVPLQAGPPPGERELVMFGRKITKGEQTHVDFALTATDEKNVLAAIGEARRQAELVVVSVHSHEPANDAEQPASFLRQFAHDAVDAGAQLIVGHGPHRLRGMEIYKGAPIFYSLGNFIYQTDGLDAGAIDPFDAGSNLYTAALGSLTDAPSPLAQLDLEWWWRSALVVAISERGVISHLKVYPVTLEPADSRVKKGLPELAIGVDADTILRQFSAVSKLLGTDLPAPSRGVLDVPISENR